MWIGEVLIPRGYEKFRPAHVRLTPDIKYYLTWLDLQCEDAQYEDDWKVRKSRGQPVYLENGR